MCLMLITKFSYYDFFCDRCMCNEIVHCTVAPQLCAAWHINIVLGIAHQHCALYCASNIVHCISHRHCARHCTSTLYAALRIKHCAQHCTSILCAELRINIVHGIAHQHCASHCASTFGAELRINIVRGIAYLFCVAVLRLFLTRHCIIHIRFLNSIL